jgi:hypothetical protein
VPKKRQKQSSPAADDAAAAAADAAASAATAAAADAPPFATTETMTDLTEKDTTIDTSAAATKDTTIETGAAVATTTNVTSDIDERKSPYRIPKKANTTMPDINNAMTMTGTPIGATSPTGSVADHDSSESGAENDLLGQSTKGNKKVSIIYDMILFPKWN